MKIQHKTTTLAQAISLSLTCAILCQPSFAMQALEDEHLKNVTGEGIAFVLNDFHLRFNGADTNNDGQGTYGTGYTHLIPVGPLSPTITAHNAATPNANGTDTEKSRALYNTQIGKGDVYLYGLSISGNDGNANTQFNTDENTNKVDIGNADNPWLIQVKTETVPNFVGVASDLAYLGIEAPLFQNLINEEGNLVADSNTYNLKLGTWADAFVRDPSKAEGDNAQFWLNSIGSDGHRYINGVDATGGTTLRENRLRLQAIINGVSLSGTNLKLFQTLDGAETAAGLGSDYSHYNNTLGLAATVRINSGDARAFRGSTYSETITSDVTDETTGRGTAGGWNNLHGGWTTSLSTAQSGGDCGNTGSVTTTTSGAPGCQYMLQYRTRDDYKIRNVSKSFTWGTASGLNNHVIRLSTRETTDSNVLTTPALSASGTVMPTFQGTSGSGSCATQAGCNTEGLYLYNPNINLVLGSQWQPLVLTSDGNNISIEITRIPDVAAVYKEIYTDYTGADASYKGGTCSIYWCGGDGNGISKNATHSSISIGSTNYTAPVNSGTFQTPLAITAYSGSGAAGVSFGDLMTMNGVTLTNSGSITGQTKTTTQARWIERILDSSVIWDYRERCTGRFLGVCTGTETNTGMLTQWKYGTTLTTGKGNITGFTDASYGSGSGSGSDRYRYPIASGSTYTDSGNVTNSDSRCPSGQDCQFYGTTTNRNWTFANYSSTYGLTFSTAENGIIDSWLASEGSLARTAYNLDTLPNQGAVPQPTVGQPWGAVNLGSAVIDGLLIQHMKITTKGL